MIFVFLAFHIHIIDTEIHDVLYQLNGDADLINCEVPCA